MNSDKNHKSKRLNTLPISTKRTTFVQSLEQMYIKID